MPDCHPPQRDPANQYALRRRGQARGELSEWSAGGSSPPIQKFGKQVGVRRAKGGEKKMKDGRYMVTQVEWTPHSLPLVVLAKEY